jgi:hypothetical protein
MSLKRKKIGLSCCWFGSGTRTFTQAREYFY